MHCQCCIPTDTRLHVHCQRCMCTVNAACRHSCISTDTAACGLPKLHEDWHSVSAVKAHQDYLVVLRVKKPRMVGKAARPRAPMQEQGWHALWVAMHCMWRAWGCGACMRGIKTAVEVLGKRRLGREFRNSCQQRPCCPTPPATSRPHLRNTVCAALIPSNSQF